MKNRIRSILFLMGLVVGLHAADDESSKSVDAPAPTLKAGESTPPSVPSAWLEVAEGAGRPGVNEHRGNWFFKSQILKKAITPVKQVQHVVKEILPFQKTFEERQKGVKKDLETFYRDYGFQESDVHTHLAAINKEIERYELLIRQPAPRPTPRTDPKTGKPLPPPPPGPKPMDEIQRLKGDISDIEKIAVKMASLRKMDEATEKGLQLLLSSIERAREAEKQAWRDYEKIADTLSDLVAEDMYRSIEAALANVKNIKKYCAETFEGFFSGLTRDAAGLEQEIKAEIEVLRKRSYPLGKLAVEQAAAEKRAAQERADAEARQKADLAKKRAAAKPKGWWATAMEYGSNAWESVKQAGKSVTQTVAGLFGQ